MWANPATAANVEALRRQGKISLVGPVEGEVASGEKGLGRMAEPEAVFEATVAALGHASDFAGRHVLVSAGPTVEDLDPVRFLGNRSSGKMGFAIAEAAAARGAQVTLVAGPVALSTPHGVTRIDVRGAMEMRAALHRAIDLGIDVLVMCAAVADYRPKEVATGKIKKSDDEITLTLVKNPDLLAEIGEKRGAATKPVLVGFAVESGDDDSICAYAKKKLAAKKVDLVVANSAESAFGGDDNRAFFVTSAGALALEPMPKRALADRILDRIRAQVMDTLGRLG